LQPRENEGARYGSPKNSHRNGASQGIGAAIIQAFLDRGYNVVATSRSLSKADFAPSPNLALIDRDIGQATTAETVAKTAIDKFGTIHHVVNNAGIFASKPFTDYTAEDFRSYVSTNLGGFIFITQLAVKEMLSQGSGGSVTTITASLASNPIQGLPASIPIAEVHVLDAGHFALDTKADEIAALVREFMKTQK
jgi:NAD(P)-dependent dehydrogenase (short-subunit alcohol dehydrogenase family)